MGQKVKLRCGLSSEAKRRFNARHPDRLGYMTESGDERCAVLWDGRKSVTFYHRDFIEICDNEQK